MPKYNFPLKRSGKIIKKYLKFNFNQNKMFHHNKWKNI